MLSCFKCLPSLRFLPGLLGLCLGLGFLYVFAVNLARTGVETSLLWGFTHGLSSLLHQHLLPLALCHVFVMGAMGIGGHYCLSNACTRKKIPPRYRLHLFRHFYGVLMVSIVVDGLFLWSMVS